MLRACIFFHAVAMLALWVPDLAAADLFEERIRPVLVGQCLQCHGPEKQKGGLRVDSRKALLQGGDSGPAVVPGQPDQSLLLKAVRHTEKDLRMPPPKAGPKLADPVIADLATWVKAGAVWPQGDTPAVAAGKEKFDLEARKKRLPWIWQTPKQQVVPDAAGPGTASAEDRFIAAKLREKGLKPGPATDDHTWLRRVHFAITGLPPRREQLQAFLADSSPDRRAIVVDRLLASPHYGERWARHWMDLVRYAESRGHESDYSIANAWRYRDYLVRAFNSDLPYHRFVAEHIAGDLLQPRLDKTSGANESVLATGWAFLGEEVHSPVDIRQDECDRIDNKLDVLSKTFLGLTVACARCHDHKFDAITQRDYYALSGFVLGSPFRQVRFETMEAHALAAVRLDDLRARHIQAIRKAEAGALQPGVATIARYLLASRRILLGDKPEVVASETGLDAGRLTHWAGQLKQADPGHPLHLFAKLALEPDALNSERFPAIFARHAQPRSPMRPEGQVIADFTQVGTTPWKSDGPAFGTRPLAMGEVVFGTPEHPVKRVMPYGAASRDAFWNRLSLTPGTEMDSGSLGAAARSGKTLLTPKSTLASGRIHYLIRGKAEVYASVDSHIMLTGPLHNALIASFDTGAQTRWVTHELGDYKGHRLHLEFTPKAEADLDVLMVVDATHVPTWLPVTAWRPRQIATSLQEVAQALQADFGLTVQRLASSQGADSRLAPLADWLVGNPGAIGGGSLNVSNVAQPFFLEQARLAKTIRWDSPTAVSWADGTGVDENVLIRGKPTLPGEIARRGLPEAFGRARITTRNTSGRAELASQITDPDNPLVARVLVNRVWHHLFGRGIVGTVDNFGYLGDRPSHPELLDHLAWKFIHQDAWSLKRLIRGLVLSDTFARTSQAPDADASRLDPANHLLARMPVRRLEGEAIRDALLVVSGRLDASLCGPPVPVHLTEFIIGRGRPEASGPLDGSGRRSLYIATRRNFLPTMMVAFDLPTPFSTMGRRDVTNVPGQSLVMMNDPFVRDQAAVSAARLLRELPDAGAFARIQWLFETACGRPPTPAETRLSLESLAELRALYPGENEAVVWAELCHALLTSNSFIYLK